jgi:hypothetical protein
MRKYLSKKRQKKKPELQPHGRINLSWKWLPTMLAFAIVSLLLGIWVIGHSQTSTAASTTISPPVTTAFFPTPVQGKAPRVQQQATGVFLLPAGGPIPVPANVLHPTNSARIVLKNQTTSIYAGSMAQSPSIGALVILQENLLSGQQSLHIYQTSQPVYALTILAIKDNIITLSTPSTKGTFDLGTDQFHFPKSQ